MNQQRINSIDATRGVALFLILFSHCIQSLFATTKFYGAGSLNHYLLKTFQLLSFHKSMMLFAVLFGLSFYFQMKKLSETHAGREKKFFAWRLFWLICFGLLNALCDGSDMLQSFGVLGVVFLVFPINVTKWHLLCAIIFLLHPFTWLEFLTGHWDGPEQWKAYLYTLAPDTRYATWWQCASWNLSGRIPCKMCVMWINGRAGEIIGLFLLGNCIGAAKLLEPQRAGTVKRLLLLGGFLWVCLFSFSGKLPSPLRAEADVLLTLLYLLGFNLLFQQSWLRWLTNLLTNIGKCTLSCYISQGVILSMLMFGWGFGWAEAMDCTGKTLLCLIIYTAQLVFCVVWLRYFRTGPLEYLWRKAVRLSCGG